MKLTEYLFNEQHLTESLTAYSYSSGFDFACKKVQSLNTMIIGFNIRYAVGGGEVTVVPLSDNEYSFTMTEDDEHSGELFLSYNSLCEFNFESEGFELDLISLTEFFQAYDVHTKTFLRNYGFKPVLEMEENSHSGNRTAENALLAINNLRQNNMYEF